MDILMIGVLAVSVLAVKLFADICERIVEPGKNKNGDTGK